MAVDTKLKSYFETLRIGSAADVQCLAYRHTFTAAPISAINDQLRFFRLPRGFVPIDCILQFTANDSHATPTGTANVIVTDGTTTRTLISAADLSAVGFVRAGNAAAAQAYLGLACTGKNQWYCALKLAAAIATAAAAGHYALALYGVVHLRADEQ